MRMRQLSSLAIGSEDWQYDIAANLLASFEDHFKANPSAKFESLESLKLTFGTVDTTSSNIIATDNFGTLHIDMMYTRVPPVTAYALSETFAPRLKTLSLHCKARSYLTVSPPSLPDQQFF